MLREIARYAAVVNDKTENIGARRLHTILERLLDELSFEASDMQGQQVTIDAAYVQRVLEGVHIVIAHNGKNGPTTMVRVRATRTRGPPPTRRRS